MFKFIKHHDHKRSYRTGFRNPFKFEQGIVSAERPFNSTFIDGEIHYYDLSHFIHLQMPL
jgi:hypothetical protein